MKDQLPTQQFMQYINGRLENGESRESKVRCPGNGEHVATLRLASARQAQQALEAARDAFPGWSAMPLEERGEWIDKLKVEIQEEKQNLQTLLLLESGKLRAHSAFETDSLTGYLTYFLEQAKCHNDEILRDISGGKGFYTAQRRALGVVVASLAWNFPLHNLATKLGPILASGCTAVIKPATKTPLSTLYMGRILQRIGFPAGVINFVAGDAGEIGKTLCESHIPAMLSMIGSTAGGLKMIRDSATSIKRYSMELGGNAPVIVTPSADIHAAAEHTIGNKMRCAGQTCVSPQRAFVHTSVYDSFVEQCISLGKKAKCGMMDDDANTGAMIDEASVQRMEAMVADALGKGAVIGCGGSRPADKRSGCYYLPTVLTGVSEDMKIFREEVFGPLLAVMPYDQIGAAIQMANHSQYGLSSYVWGNDYNELARIVNALEYGIVNINGPGTGVAYPHGGCKDSGIGKDGSGYSLEEYYYIKGARVALQP